MIPAWLAFFDGILALALFVVGPLGAHFDLIPPFMGFQLFLLGSLIGVLGLLLGLIGLFRTRGEEHRAVRPRATVGVVVGALITAIMAVQVARSLPYPPINDITTDFENPPEFVHATELAANKDRDLKYHKAVCADRQMQGYGKLEPLAAAADADATFEKAKAVAAAMPSWQITYTDPQSRTLEGVCTSALFHFQDDFIIQVRPVDASHSLVEMRSKSRDGVGDLGVNFRRIRRFFAKLAPETGASS